MASKTVIRSTQNSFHGNVPWEDLELYWDKVQGEESEGEAREGEGRGGLASGFSESFKKNLRLRHFQNATRSVNRFRYYSNSLNLGNVRETFHAFEYPFRKRMKIRKRYKCVLTSSIKCPLKGFTS